MILVEGLSYSTFDTRSIAWVSGSHAEMPTLCMDWISLVDDVEMSMSMNGDICDAVSA